MDAEITRKKYKYRSLILRGRVRLPQKAAYKLVGPDCAYHLYSNHQTETDETSTPKSD